jgi:hypothetical protein
MRALVLASVVSVVSLAALAACSGPVRVQNFSAGPNGSFVYRAHTNTVMTENSDGGAEQIRRDWLAETLLAHGVCNTGYVIDDRHLDIPAQRPALITTLGPANPVAASYFGNGGDVVYNGRCL